MSDARPELSLVVPVWNEAQSLGALEARLTALLEQLATPAEVIFVDDHSTDASRELLRAMCRKDERLRYLRLARNRGSHVAILAGLAHARGQAAVFLAADLQDPPELVLEMRERWRGGHAVVWAVRAERPGVGIIDRAMSSLFYGLLGRMSRVRLPPSGSDFALLDRRAVRALVASAGAGFSLGGAIADTGFDADEVRYVKEARRFGRSSWTLGRKLQAFADAFVSFSHLPLRATSYLGIALSLLGGLYAALVVGLRLIADRPVEGWASLMVVVLVLGGVQMIMLGVAGEYLWRALEEARRRPHFVLEDWYGLEAETVSARGELPIERERG